MSIDASSNSTRRSSPLAVLGGRIDRAVEDDVDVAARGLPVIGWAIVLSGAPDGVVRSWFGLVLLAPTVILALVEIVITRRTSARS